MQDSPEKLATRFGLLKGILPLNRAAALRDVFAGITLASMDIPQVLGYARIAGMPAVTGLYTVFLPLTPRPQPFSPASSPPWRRSRAANTSRLPAWSPC
jgi:hypothetical protein